jgi:hypothetical protein
MDKLTSILRKIYIDAHTKEQNNGVAYTGALAPEETEALIQDHKEILDCVPKELPFNKDKGLEVNIFNKGFNACRQAIINNFGEEER